MIFWLGWIGLWSGSSKSWLNRLPALIPAFSPVEKGKRSQRLWKIESLDRPCGSANYGNRATKKPSSCPPSLSLWRGPKLRVTSKRRRRERVWVPVRRSLGEDGREVNKLTLSAFRSNHSSSHFSALIWPSSCARGKPPGVVLFLSIHSWSVIT
jgi:hypothetical protein